jgi:hypothetical protein
MPVCFVPLMPPPPSLMVSVVMTGIITLSVLPEEIRGAAGVAWHVVRVVVCLGRDRDVDARTRHTDKVRLAIGAFDIDLKVEIPLLVFHRDDLFNLPRDGDGNRISYLWKIKHFTPFLVPCR